MRRLLQTYLAVLLLLSAAGAADTPPEQGGAAIVEEIRTVLADESVPQANRKKILDEARARLQQLEQAEKANEKLREELTKVEKEEAAPEQPRKLSRHPDRKALAKLEQELALARYRAGNRKRHVQALESELAALKASDLQSKDSRGLRSTAAIERTKLSAADGRRHEVQILDASDLQSTEVPAVGEVPGIESPKLLDGQRPSARGAVLDEKEAAATVVEMPSDPVAKAEILSDRLLDLTRRAKTQNLEIRLKIARIQARTAEKRLQRMTGLLRETRRRLRKSPEELASERKRILDRRKELDQEIDRLTKALGKFPEETGLVEPPRGNEDPDQALASEVARTALEATAEERQTRLEQLATARLERSIQDNRLQTLEALSAVDDSAIDKRKQQASRLAGLMRRLESEREQDLSAVEAADKLVRIAEDDREQLERALASSRDRIKEGALLRKRRSRLQKIVASLEKASGFVHERIETLKKRARVIKDRIEIVDEAIERIQPILARQKPRVTVASFRDLVEAVRSAFPHIVAFVANPLSSIVSVGRLLDAQAFPTGALASNLLLLLLLAAGVSTGAAKICDRALAKAPPLGLLRALLALIRYGLPPVLLSGTAALALLPYLPPVLPAASSAPASIDSRLVWLFLACCLAISILVGILLLPRSLRLSGEVSGRVADWRLAWRPFLASLYLGFLGWLSLTWLTTIARVFSHKASVPFLLQSGALLLAIATAVVLALLSSRSLASFLGARKVGAPALLTGVTVAVISYLLALAVYGLAGYGAGAYRLFFRSVKALLVAAGSLLCIQLTRRATVKRLRGLDEIEKLTGRSHELERETYRLFRSVAVVAEGAAGFFLILSLFGIGAGDAMAAASEVASYHLVEIYGIDLTVSSVLGCIIIIASAIFVSRTLRRILKRYIFPRAKVDLGVQNALSTILNYIILLIAFFMGFQAMGFNLTTLKVVAGAVGLGIGFGLQNIAANFISGLIILLERPINPQDVVEVGGTLGKVERVSARATLLRTRDNISVIVPNTEFIASRVVNWSHRDPKMRIHIDVGVAYGTEVEKLLEILLEVASRQPGILSNPPPEVRFLGFGASSLDFQLLSWIPDPWMEARTKSALYFAVEAALRHAGIEIPFPQRDLHLIDMPAKRHGPLAAAETNEEVD